MPLNTSVLPANTFRTIVAGMFTLLTINTSSAQKKLQDAQVLYKGDGVIAYIDRRGAETEISKAAVDTTPIVYNNQVLMVEAVEHSDDKSGITAWDTRKKTKTVLVKPGTKANREYVIQDKIVHILMDPKSKRLFFSTYSKTIKEYQTWDYDFATGKVQVFNEGLVQNVDEAGNVTLVIYSNTLGKPYTREALFSSNGVLLNMQEKKYY